MPLQVAVRMNRSAGAKSALVRLYATWPVNQAGSNLVNCAFKLEWDHEWGTLEKMVRVDLALLLGECDEHRGTPLTQQLQRWAPCWRRPWPLPRFPPSSPAGSRLGSAA
jgi:hypothetical protein